MPSGRRQTFNIVQAISLAGLGEIEKNRQVYEAFWARSHTIAQLAMLIADERQRCATSSPTRPTWPASSTIAAYPC